MVSKSSLTKRPHVSSLQLKPRGDRYKTIQKPRGKVPQQTFKVCLRWTLFPNIPIKYQTIQEGSWVTGLLPKAWGTRPRQVGCRERIQEGATPISRHELNQPNIPNFIPTSNPYQISRIDRQHPEHMWAPRRQPQLTEGSEVVRAHHWAQTGNLSGADANVICD